MTSDFGDDFKVSSLRAGGEQTRHYTVIHLPTGRVAEFESEEHLSRSQAIARFRELRDGTLKADDGGSTDG